MASGHLRVLTALAVAAMIGLTAVPATAEGSERVTFYKDVLPILQENCQACHRPAGLDLGGMIAPMSLIEYNEVRPWAKAIVRQVTTRTMPPWHTTSEFDQVFSNQRTLTDKEIATIERWVESGAPRGRQQDAPQPLDFPTGEWSIGEPDLIVAMPEPYFVEDDVEDLYVNFEVTITEDMLPEARWIQASETRSGSTAVHHIIARPVGGSAPGIDATFYPDGYGALLEPGATVTFNMHYHKEPGPGTGVWDQSKVAVKFHTKPVTHPITTSPVGNRGFEVPPNHPNWEVGASRIFEESITLISLLPHMHLRGKDAKYVAFYPDGSTEVLLDVPNYDFNWQTRYLFAEPKVLPAGTRVEVTMHFDNSTGNAANPNPNRPVSFGGPTTDEMMLGWMNFASTDPIPDPLLDAGTD
ncbi:MAG: alkyl hydroperoxide reductase [Candidatus Hydrogenedentes bacterium]|nr:alkyl hydroperoxide reductase [Candidatus Hydrogenedentota bacterium]